VSVPYPEASGDTADPAVLLERLLDYYRATVVERVRALDARGRRTSLVPSGWTPVEMLSHLVHMERRWFSWGFLGEAVDAPWGDFETADRERWHVPDDVTVDDLAARLDEVAAATTALLRSTPPTTLGATTGRFRTDPPTLAAIGFHVLQEYARHAGHLDVVVELAGGPTGD
jgi:uncharacterized damage-inducible protein DinB